MSAQPTADVSVVEEVDAIVVSEPRPLPARRISTQLVAAQAAVGAASFVAGAAAVVVVSRRRAARRGIVRGRGRGRRGKRGPDIASTRSFLVDVHLLDKQ